MQLLAQNEAAAAHAKLSAEEQHLAVKAAAAAAAAADQAPPPIKFGAAVWACVASMFLNAYSFATMNGLAPFTLHIFWRWGPAEIGGFLTVIGVLQVLMNGVLAMRIIKGIGAPLANVVGGVLTGVGAPQLSGRGRFWPL